MNLRTDQTDGLATVGNHAKDHKDTNTQVNQNTADIAANATAIAAKYTKPGTGIPKTDLDAATQTSLGRADTALQTAPVSSVAGKTGAVTLTKGDVGLGNVDNTSDAAKPISAATKAYVDALAAATVIQYKTSFIVGFSNADYVIDGTSDEAEINAAIAAANAAGGGEVIIKALNVNLSGPIFAKSNVTVIGTSRAVTLKLINGANCGLLWNNGAAISNFSISNLTIDGNAANQTSNATTGQAAVAFTGSGSTTLENILLDSLTIKNTYKHGVFFTGDNTSTNIKVVRNCKIVNHGPSSVGFGLYTDYAPGVIFHGNRIETSNGNDAIELGHLGGTAVENDLKDGQLQYPFGDNSLIMGNIVRSNTIQNDGNTANNVVIVGNRVLNASPIAGFGGISLTGANGVVTGNTVVSTANNGIRIYGDGNVITANNVNGSDKDTGVINGIYLDHMSHGVVQGNRIRNANKAITLVFDYNVVSGNTVDSCNTGVECSAYANSGHAMVGNQVYGNVLDGAAVPLNLNGQSTAIGPVQGVDLISAGNDAMAYAVALG